MKTYVPHTVRIRLQNAAEVSIVGDFNHWHSRAHPLVQVTPGTWERIVDLPTGKQRYAFFVIDDIAASAGAVRSRIVGNGSVIFVSNGGEQGVSIIAHPELATFQRHEPARTIEQAAPFDGDSVPSAERLIGAA